MITRDQFEAHVRAEADERYPTQEAEREADRDLFATLNNEQKMRQAAYIAARMEHEWPLVEALQDTLHDLDTCDWTCERCGEDYRMPDTDIHLRVTDALSPYTTKPTER